MLRKNLCFFVFFIILLTNLSGALGIVSDYNRNKPVFMESGESKTIDFRVLGAIDEAELVISLVKGSEVASINEDKKYVISSKTTFIPIEINVPSRAKRGTIYPILVSFNNLVNTEAGGIALGTSIEYGFDVVVGDVSNAPEVNKLPIIVLVFIGISILSLISLIVLIVIFYRKNKSKTMVENSDSNLKNIKV